MVLTTLISGNYQTGQNRKQETQELERCLCLELQVEMEITLTRSPACLLIPFSYVLAHDVIDFVSNLWVLIAREDLELTGS